MNYDLKGYIPVSESYWQQGCDDARLGKYAPPTWPWAARGYNNGHKYGSAHKTSPPSLPQMPKITPTSGIDYTDGGTSHRINITNAIDWKSFQELVQRGINLWPDAPPQIKEFADLVTSGQIMQDYYKQVNITRPTTTPTTYLLEKSHD